MEYFISNFLPEIIASGVPEAAATTALDTAATDLAATAATDLAATAAADTAASSAIPGILTGTASATPEAIAASEAAAAAPSILTGTASATPEAIANAATTQAAPEASGILQATNTTFPDYGQLPQLGTETNIPGPEALSTGPNYAAIPPDAASQVADKGIGSYFDQGWKSASDLFSDVGDKLDKASNWIEAHPKTSLGLGIAGAKIIDAMTRQGLKPPEKYNGPLSKYHLASNYKEAEATPNYYTPTYGASGEIGRAHV